MAKSSPPVSAMLTISRSIRLSKSQDGGILLDVEQGAMFGLNVVGARIVELLNNGHAPSSLVDTISHEFQATPETVRRDVDHFLVVLREQRLLVDENAGDPTKRGDA
jgi:hypothetical protein